MASLLNLFLRGFCLVLLSQSCVFALFEDQVGKFDWRRQLIGRITEVQFDRATQTLFVASSSSVLASLHFSDGEIDWRKVPDNEELQKAPASGAPQLLQLQKSVVTLSSDGRSLSSWDKASGVLKWQYLLDHGHSLLSVSDGVLVLGAESISFVAKRTGELRWSTKLSQRLKWHSMVSGGEAEVAALGYDTASPTDWTLTRLSVNSGQILAEKSLDGQQWALNRLRQLDRSNYFADLNVETGQLGVVRLTVDGRAEAVAKIDQVAAVNLMTVDGDVDSTAYLVTVTRQLQRTQKIGWHRLGGGKFESIPEWSFEYRLNEQNPPISQVFGVLTTRQGDGGTVGRALALTADGSFTAFHANGETWWSRPEALSESLAVEMFDLPLSESQADIEKEFAVQDENVALMFVRRLRSQALQVRHWLVRTAEDSLAMMGLLDEETAAKVPGSLPALVGQWLDSYRASDETANGRRRPRDAGGKALERDYFNLHKVVVVVTQAGMVFGVDNRQGAVVWRYWLEDFTPFESSVAVKSVYLFQQRTTAHFPHPAQCVVVCKHQTTGLGLVFALDPNLGTLVQRVDLGFKLAQVALLPYTTADGVHGVLLAGNQLNAEIYPSDTILPADSQSNIFLTSVLERSSVLKGYQFVAKSAGVGQLQLVWQSNLPLDAHAKITHVAAKRFSERTHSQGRVLGDRSVLYKYVNPNLVALVAEAAAADGGKAGLVQLFLVDAVSGQVVFSAQHAKSAGPVHLVHCENWITYSLWNEKSRRTELSVLELYEGGLQTDPDHFSSLAPTLSPPVVLKQSYVFPQGVSAIGVTNTEKGLTNRQVLIALPFGGILELPKALLDPRRPIVPTMETQEEGVPPYMPELPVATEHIVNYNQSVLGVRALDSAPAGLESTSLLLARGLDLYFTRLTPSGTFDILKDDFDHWLISAALLGLIVAAVVSKRFARRRDLKMAWK